MKNQQLHLFSVYPCVIMNSSSIYILVFVQLWLLSLPCRESVCIPSERETLLKFKNNLIDPSNRLWSWNHNHTNCCHWYGVLCHSVTSHVLQLHLNSSHSPFNDDHDWESYRRWSFGGEISPCLADLKHLNYLDLSGNIFFGAGMSIPSFLGTMTSLTHLDLSLTGFMGKIPPQIGNLSKLRYLDLSFNDLLGEGMAISSFLCAMSSLTHLDLSDTGIHGKIPPQIGNLSNLVYLDLSSVVANGTVPSQIGNLSKLRYLDLSGNEFLGEGMSIPSFLCAMTSLTHLDLSGNGFMGKIPSQIGNLSNLVYLGLGGHSVVEPLFAENVEWVSSMWKLEYLHLSNANLSKAFHWLHTLQSLPSLTRLYLSNCTLPHYNEPSLLNFSSLQTLHLSVTSYSPAISFVPKWIFKLKKLVSLQLPGNEIQGPIPGGIRNLTLLQNLDLSENSFSSSIPDCLYGLHRLKSLDLSSSNLHGTISDALENLTSLVELDLSYNQLEGTIPTSLGNLTSLVELDLSHNQLEGTIPTFLGNLRNLREINLKYLYLSFNKFSGNPFESLGSLSKLSYLYIDGNNFQGVVKEDDLANLTSLERFFASENNLTLKVGSNWLPSFQLTNLDVRSWQLGPSFPSWIQSQNKLTYLDMSNTGIIDSIPTQMWEALSQVLHFNLSHNHIHGELVTTLKNPISNQIVDLSTNHLRGKLPYLSNALWLLSLPCRESVCIPSERETLLKFKNNLNDPSNRLWSWNPNNTNCCHWYGVLCHNHLNYLDLSGNYFLEKGMSIPSFLGTMTSLTHLNLSYTGFLELRYLDLSANEFLGKGMAIPSFLYAMTSLTHLDLSYSRFMGKIPPQIGNLSNLVYLDLRYVANGTVPSQIGNLSKLQYLDLSYNYFLGEGMAIPSFLCAMTSLTHLDLSITGFRGKIPPQIGNLSNLVYLDLSSVVANGTVPSQIGNLSKLRYLDLSGNEFLGEGMSIPSFLCAMTSLTHLDLSGNGFMGKIPSQIGNLSNLVYLRLGGNYLFAENVEWVSSMWKLEYLHLSNANLSKAFHWLHTLQSLPSLTHLYLSDCTLPHYNEPSLLNFSSLQTLYLYNTSYSPAISFVPKWIFKLKKLVSLQLVRNGIQGPIPGGIRNLTLLQNLDLSENSFSSSIPDCLYGLHRLMYLDLSYNNLLGTISDALGNLTSLVVLDLSGNQLEGNIPTSLGNLCNLRVIDLSYLKLNQQVNELLQILAPCISHGLTRLEVQSSRLSGNLTDHIGAFKNIVRLYFSNNSIGGALPRSFGKLSSLRYLDLSINKFSGNPFESLGSLSKLSSLNIDDNLFHGVVKETDLANLTSLTEFDASGNNFTLKVGPNWIPNFQLTYLEVTSWQLGPSFPLWIQSQNQLEYVGLSNTGIFGSIPTQMWEALSQVSYLNLSRNHFHGEIGTTLKNPISIPTIDLSSNHLCGKLPYLSSDVFWLDLSSNSFSESMNDFLCNDQDEPMQLEFLNLASNNLSGEIPDCWMNWTFLADVNLQSNHFVGNLPQSMGSLAELQSLQIRNNTLSGIFPTSLKKNNQLISLDLGENNLSGSIPTWVGENLLNVKILRLRSNRFGGHIPNEICQMSHLQVLDLAQNNLSGNIPSCFSNLSAMTLKNQSTDPRIYSQGKYGTSYSSMESIVSVLLWLKGRGDEYRNFLGLVTSIDLSSNKLLGEIPREITYLNGLDFLNLSHNQLIGHIPQGIGNMRSLQSIDFSRNQLSGEIPPSIANLSFLSMLDLSYNHLKGNIPTGTQLQTFDASSFIGNNLCGPPLPINCSSNGKTHSYEGSDGHGVNWFFVSMTIGFIVGFWIVIAPLLICRSWRYAYFHFLDHVWFKLQSFRLGSITV
ncbi:Receptor-like protein EIX2 [Glycine soja]